MPEDVFSSLVRELSVWAAERWCPCPQGDGARVWPEVLSWRHTPVLGLPQEWGACGEHENHRSSCWASEMSNPGSLCATCTVLWAGQPGERCTASEGRGLWPAPAQAGAKLCPVLPPEQQSYLRHLSDDVGAGCEGGRQGAGGAADAVMPT